MRHKTFLIYPGLIKDKGIKINKCIQNPREFVITLGRCYHAGFNLGFNCAEAVNFAIRSWISFGLAAGACICLRDSVKIDMNSFMKNLQKKKKMNKLDTNNLPFTKKNIKLQMKENHSQDSEEPEQQQEIKLLNKKRKKAFAKDKNNSYKVKRKYKRKNISE